MNKKKHPIGHEDSSNNENQGKFPGGRGYVTGSKGTVVTFEIQGFQEQDSIRGQEYRNIYSRYQMDNQTMRLQDYVIPLWGEGHNLYPQEVYSTISENKLIPEVKHKQAKFLFGKGPRLYREEIQGEGKDARRVRIPVQIKEIEDWLESWEDNGYDHYWEYLRNLINDYYLVDTCVSKYHFSKARRLNGLSFPVQALSYVGSDEARLATKNQDPRRKIKNQDCKFVVVGDWLNPNYYDYEVFNRFDPADPFKFSPAIAFNREKTFSKEVYAFNNWFKGLFEWIKAENLSPKYLNSYLKNALNSHVHAKIPVEWVNKQIEILQSICHSNAEGNAPIQAEYRGVKLLDEKGLPIAFYETMVDQVITHELKNITRLMSGEGKNQGKMYATIQFGEQGWVFEDFPGKFKEYFETVITYDKRSDQVILAGLGISSSISNVENDGVISKSGSDVYYNYLIYIAGLTLDEYFVTKELNRSMRMNFQRAKTEGIKIGFWIDVPAKLQETSEKDRPANTATADPKTEVKETNEQKDAS